ncbi:MAG: ChpI protein [Burkholderiales bacterium]|nr:ChpI protein [Burkholderiales bacterium]
MKTAISVPDEIFESADQLAKRKGMSRSELYVTALKDFLSKHSEDEVTAKLDQIYGNEPGLEPALQSLQSRSLRKTKW